MDVPTATLIAAIITAIVGPLIVYYLTHRDQVGKLGGKKWIWNATSLKHKVGRKYSDTEWGASVPSSQDHIAYGQYIDLKRGIYTAKYRLKIDNNDWADDEAALLDVVCAKNSHDAGRIITKRSVRRKEFAYPQTYEDFSVSFTLDKHERRVEFRVWYANTAEVVIDTIEVVSGDSQS